MKPLSIIEAKRLEDRSAKKAVVSNTVKKHEKFSEINVKNIKTQQAQSKYSSTSPTIAHRENLTSQNVNSPRLLDAICPSPKIFSPPSQSSSSSIIGTRSPMVMNYTLEDINVASTSRFVIS
jgi:hypothetical protein